MANVRVRPETGNLYLDFQWRGVRCREQTLLPDNAQNRKTLESLAKRIKRDITRGTFSYSNYFPDSPRARAFEVAPQASQGVLKPAPSNPENAILFAQAAEDWFIENQPRWRSTNAATTRSILDHRLLPTFGEVSVALIKDTKLPASLAALSRSQLESLLRQFEKQVSEQGSSHEQ